MHKGERHFIRGPLDGQIDQLSDGLPKDYPEKWIYPSHPNGYYQRCTEVIDGLATYVWVAGDDE